MEYYVFNKAEAKKSEIRNCENVIKEFINGDNLQALGRIYADPDEKLIDLIIAYYQEKLELLKVEFKEI